MDRKIKVFISCLLIAIPVVTGITSLFVKHPEKKPVNIVAQSHVSVPTGVLHPTPTHYIFPPTLQIKISNDAGKLHALDIKASAVGIVIDHQNNNPAVTPTVIAPSIVQNDVASSSSDSSSSTIKSSAQLLLESSRSAVIIDKPSSMVVTEDSSNSSSNSFLSN